jgi:hypothetical protein
MVGKQNGTQRGPATRYLLMRCYLRVLEVGLAVTSCSPICAAGTVAEARVRAGSEAKAY